MKIILTSIGTRGDMEPFLAIGEILVENGHEVICLFPEQFRNLSEDSGFKFASLGSKFIDLLDSPEGRIAMGGGKFGFKKLRAYMKLISRQSPVNKEMVEKQCKVIEREQPDRIVHNGKTIYPIIWSLKNPNKNILISPVPYLHYVKDHSHVGFHNDFGPFFNKITYKIANYGLVKTIMSSVKWITGDKSIKQKEIQGALFSSQAIYTVSPSLFERPDYWPEHLHVLGYHERKKTNHWKASPELEAFLQKHPKLVFITFGSMVNSEPVEKTQIIIDILERNAISAIINTASGGLVKPQNYHNDLIHFVDHIPYDWVFQKMHAVIHHGGSGTTHSALKYGCASLIIPHIIDQYVWNRINFRKGSGPMGMDISKLKRKNLEPLILDLISNKGYKEKAEELGAKMQKEDFRKELYDSIVQ